MCIYIYNIVCVSHEYLIFRPLLHTCWPMQVPNIIRPAVRRSSGCSNELGEVQQRISVDVGHVEDVTQPGAWHHGFSVGHSWRLKVGWWHTILWNNPPQKSGKVLEHQWTCWKITGNHWTSDLELLETVGSHLLEVPEGFNSFEYW